jgi:hypothetical protein
MLIQKVVINGKVYSLQHPGNREWIKLKGTIYNVQKDQINSENLLDYCFEHVVFPEKGEKITLDNCEIRELEVWQEILPSFLRGRLENGYVWPDTRQAIKEGQRLLQTESKK